MNDYGNQTGTATNGFYDQKAAYDTKERNPDAFYNVAEQANNRMGDFLVRLSTLTDILCGGQPPSVDTGSAGQLRGIPNGHFANATDQCGQIMVKLEQADRLLERIRSQL